MSKSLFDKFDAVSAKQWKQKIQFDLKGADYNETLLWQSPEGITVKPFYNREDLDPSGLPVPESGNWKIGQRFFVDDLELTRKLAASALERGAESLIFDYGKPFEPSKLLNGLSLDGVAVHFGPGPGPLDFLKQLGSYTAAGIHSKVYFDPLSRLAYSGNWFKNKKTDLDNWKALTSGNQAFGIDLRGYANAGANLVQELAYSLLELNEYMEVLGHSDDSLMPFLQIDVQLAVGSNYFFEIAKLRAFRILVEALTKDWGYEAEVHIMAQPGTRNKTLYDYNVNMLRTTTESMSAVLGGANTVVNLAYDAIYHKDNEFGSRIARNQLLVLKHESYFDWVENPADGSYYIESITTQLAAQALELFKELEASGGFLQHLSKGTLQRKIKESAQKEQALFDAGELPLVGTNIFQNPDDRMKDDLELYPFVKTDIRKTTIQPIIAKRLSEQIEKQRLDEEK